MVQLGGGFRFGMKPLNEIRRSPLACQDHFERDNPLQADLPRLIDNSHSTAGDFLEQFIVAEIPDLTRDRQTRTGGVRDDLNSIFGACGHE